MPCATQSPLLAPRPHKVVFLDIISFSCRRTIPHSRPPRRQQPSHFASAALNALRSVFRARLHSIAPPLLFLFIASHRLHSPFTFSNHAARAHATAPGRRRPGEACFSLQRYCSNRRTRCTRLGSHLHRRHLRPNAVERRKRSAGPEDRLQSHATALYRLPHSVCECSFCSSSIPSASMDLRRTVCLSANPS